MRQDETTRFRPSRRWGQNFLRNPAAVERIVETLAPRGGDFVLEIGPGDGALTARLVQLPIDLLAIEIDPRLVDRLSRRFATPAFRIIEADATEAPLPDQPFLAVGNLPYNVATPILRRVVASLMCRRAVFMVQKEVAGRLTARPGDDEYGFLSLVVALDARPRVVMTLGPGSFRPRPRVDSAIVLLEIERYQAITPRDSLVELISAAFGKRRKKLSNAVSGFRGVTRPIVEEVMVRVGLDPGIRAERLSLEDFDRLGSALLSVVP